MTLNEKNARLQAVQKLIEKETSTLRELEARVKTTRERLEALLELQKLYSSGEPEQGVFPTRMRENYKQFLLWIAEAPDGRTREEIAHYCSESKTLDERKASFFVANYRSVRYGLLETNNGIVSITRRGMMYLRREGLLKDE